MPEFNFKVTVSGVVSASSEHAARTLLDYLFDRHITHGTSYIVRAKVEDETVEEIEGRPVPLVGELLDTAAKI